MEAKYKVGQWFVVKYYDNFVLSTITEVVITDKNVYYKFDTFNGYYVEDAVTYMSEPVTAHLTDFQDVVQS